MARKIMLLTFSVKVNKYKPARVNVHCNQTSQHLGSFNLDMKKPQDFDEWAALDEKQQFEFSLYFYNLKYLMDETKADPLTLENFRLLLSAPIITAMGALSVESLKQELTFDPITAMMNGLLNYCRNIENKLCKNNSEFSALALAGIDLTSKQSVYKKEKETQLKLIFHELAQVYNKHDKILKVAALFGKSQTLSENTIKLAGQGKSKVSSWMVACAIIVLAGEKNKALATLDNDEVIELWLKPLIRLEIVKSIDDALKISKQHLSFLNYKKNDLKIFFE
jgi:hypothetical protein